MTSASQHRILLADDDRLIRKICQNTLEPEGYSVDMAENGQQALEMIIEKDFDLLITDIEMPVMDGMALLLKLQEIPVAPPVIVFTAFGDIPKAVQALRRGAYDFITKPFFSDTLLATIRRCLENHALKREIESLRMNQRLLPLFEAVINTLESAKVMDILLSTTCDLLEADGGSVLLYDPDHNHLVVKALRGPYAEPILGKKIGVGERVVGYAIDMARLITINGTLQSDPRFSALPTQQKVNASMICPMMIRKQPVGVLSIKRLAAVRPFLRLDEQIFQLIANHGALAISNALAHENLGQTKDLLEHQLEQRSIAFEKTLAELQDLKKKLG